MITTNFLRFHFHSVAPVTKYATARTGLFSSRQAFEGQMARLDSMQGWQYFADMDDRAKNANPEVVPCLMSKALSFRSEGAWVGPYQHSHVFVVTLENAKAVAEGAGCSVERAAEADFRELVPA